MDKPLTFQEAFDYVIIGSGFGGAVSAMRLAEKGYKVLVIEKGKKWNSNDFPKSNWNIKKFLWLPIFRFFGFQQLSFFKKVFVLSGVGFGGGSLVYANTHMIPDKKVFQSPNWSKKIDWEKDFYPFYKIAKKMLGTTLYPHEEIEDTYLKQVARDFGKEDTFQQVPVGVYFGDTHTETDPYFNGLGPLRKGCIKCAGCMVGCRHNAKNTLDKNYLFFAEYYGAKFLIEQKVVKIIFNEENQNYTLFTNGTTKSNSYQIQTKGLVFSAGVLGTMELLLAQKYYYKTLTNLSDRLGEQIRTNSEMIAGVACTKKKVNNGVAITSVFNADEDTHIEVVKYPDGSGLMGRLGVLATGNGSPLVRTAKLIGNIITQPFAFIKTFFNLTGASNTVILLIMQSLDSSLKMKWKKSFWGNIVLESEDGKKIPSFIELGQKVLFEYAKKANGIPMNSAPEVLLGMSTTAHILGGVPMGDTIKDGVINENFQVHGYPNMYILDGSIIQTNLGVNPSLTITALAEFAMSKIPEHPQNTHLPLDTIISKS
jgi:cholesterol oxidase